MDNIDMGESSCRKKTNNDKMSEGERPLKKAKYPWQIKGKCHLKEQGNEFENKQSSMETSSEATKENTNVPSGSEVPSTTKNLEILGDYLLKKDFNIPAGETSESEINSNKSDMEEDDGDMMDIFSSHNAVMNDTENESASTRLLNSNEPCSGTYSNTNESHPSLVEDKNNSLDTYIARWQARQIAKGFVDNTINRVLDSWLVAPLPQTYDETHNLALDVAEFFDNLPASNTVENEGILMAISAHGLQNNQGGSRNTNEQRAQPRNYGTRMTIAISECVSRNDSPNLHGENQESGASTSSENVRHVPEHEGLSDMGNKDNDDASNNICQPIATSSTASSSSSSRLDHRKSHSDNELCSALIEGRCSADGSNILCEPSWRPLPQPCSCSQSARRVNVPPCIPFHKRDSSIYSNRSIISHSPSPPLPSTSPDQNIPQCTTNTVEVIPSESLTEEPLESNNLYSGNQEFDDHFDFMDAAVSFAIQNKGLTSFSSVDYG